MKKSVKLSVAIFYLFLCIPVFSLPIFNESLPADDPTQEAVLLVQKLITSEDSEKSEIFKQFKNLLDENPENINVRKMYTNSLLADRYYAEGLQELEILNKKHFTRTDLLTECMVKERLGKRDDECYRQVIHLSEQQQSIDSDYLTALFFANDKRFEPLKNRLIKEGVFKESDLLIFTLSKETMLREFYP
ncbi:hypothetical protein BF17_16255 [Yersinia similis]|uniref:Uncharacterized protein n=1 Tax=Yersinia similis TaxID=367190 RepID=A0ABM5Q068_9GAMM|nr:MULTISPECIES: hypothetical protein [Yersinia pseudotuberculosis complex]AHK20678.1 hypothetical protein BF17_16255 [Yersinia similis]CFQ74135.1 Uncharacterised protein [Yersinia similis]CNC24341.1 Uncharacterised protein [Yersinia similis]CND23563.1 Uncharacterised protein [Yersinia pseudotuberculosis]CNF45635.1 Uncharacterised protein [Yersinia similis]